MHVAERTCVHAVCMNSLVLTSGLDENVHGDLGIRGRKVDVKLKASTRIGSAFWTCMPQLSSGKMFLSVEAGAYTQTDVFIHSLLWSWLQMQTYMGWGAELSAGFKPSI